MPSAPTEEIQVVFDFTTAQKKARQIMESRALLRREVEKLGDAEGAFSETDAAKRIATLSEEIKAKRTELLDDEDLAELVDKKRAAVKKAKSTAAGQRVADCKAGVKALKDGIAAAQRELAEGVSNSAK